MTYACCAAGCWALPDDQKLIAAKAANDIFPARDSGESFADLHQKAVAARMAEPIVNGFETIGSIKISETCCCWARAEASVTPAA